MATKPDLKELITANLTCEMTPEQKEAQRRSFAYGNTKIENDSITREIVNSAADALCGSPVKKDA